MRGGPELTNKRTGLKVIILASLAILCLSLVYFMKQPAPIIAETQPTSNETCLKCHSKANLENVDTFPGSVDHSTHKSLLCSDCHTYAHETSDKPKLDLNNGCLGCHTTSMQNPQGVDVKSGSKGTVGTATAMNTSVLPLQDNIHSKALTGGSGALCTDCHGIHNIQPVDNPKSSVYKSNVEGTCTKCHQDVIESYNYSFHGTAVNLGSLKAASCTDCHGSHAILPPNNPVSTVAKGNVPDTCAKCHDNPEPNFAKGSEHSTPYNKDAPGAFPLWIVWKFFIGLILFDVIKDCTIAIFELIRKLRNKRQVNVEHHKHWDV
jgi:nitrate/TMAO reductase-like tetraheme cytochrome c subunit